MLSPLLATLALPSLLAAPQEIATRSLEIDGVASGWLDTFEGGSFLHLVSHELLAGRDLNGDGDAFDPNVLSVLETRSETLWQTRTSPVSTTRIGERWLLLVRERDLGIDLTGNGQAFDHAYLVGDPVAGTLEPLPLAANPNVVLWGTYSALPKRDAVVVQDLGQRILRVDLDTRVVDDLGRAGARAAFGVTPFQTGTGLPMLEDGLVDLNADGDEDDEVWHLLDAERPALRNLGFAGDFFLPGLARPVGIVREADNDLDANGDGDRTDRFLRVFSRGFQTASDVPLALADDNYGGLLPAPNGRWIVLSVNEDLQGADLNGDGDRGDGVPFVLDLRTGRTRQLEGTMVGAPFLPWSPGSDRVLLIASERQEGVDLDGDGSATANLLVAHDLKRGTRAVSPFQPATRLIGSFLYQDRGTARAWSGTTPATSRYALLTVGEDARGDGDGDGARLGVILQKLDTATGELSETGLVILPGTLEVDGREATMLAFEGTTDRNGDGVVSFELVVACRLDLVTGDAHFGSALHYQFAQRTGDHAFGRVPETVLGRDATGDGDLADEVHAVVSLRTGERLTTDIARGQRTGALSAVTSTGDVFVLADEPVTGRDLNGDGDGTDWGVLHVYGLPARR